MAIELLSDDESSRKHHKLYSMSRFSNILKIKHIFLVLLLLFISFSVLSFNNVSGIEKESELPLKVYCHNIRYDNRNLDGSERYWVERKAEVVKSIRFNSFNSPILVSLQEVLRNQLDDILQLLNENEANENEWRFVGAGRDDGKDRGEFSPILYKSSQFRLTETKVSWLSETPDVPGSVGWDADQTRIVTWAHFESLDTGLKLNLFNTHLDHIGRISRENSVKLISKMANSYNNDLTIITGDFNSQPHEEAYKTISRTFQDSNTASIENGSKYGFTNTVSGFKNKASDFKIIDYVFLDERIDTQSQLLGFGILDNKFEGIYSSDHRPVMAQLLLERDD